MRVRPGAGGGGGRADRADDARRPVHARGARPGAGLVQRRLGRVEPGGPGAGGRVDRPAFVALGLLRDGAVRGGLGLDPGRGTSTRRSSGDEVLPIDWPGAMLLAAGSTLLLLAVLNGDGRSWTRGARLLAAGGRPAGAVRPSGASSGRPDLAARPDRRAAHRRGDRGELPDRRPAVRARHVHPALRPGGARGYGDAGGADDHAAVPELGDQRGGRGRVVVRLRVPPDGGGRLDPDRLGDDRAGGGGLAAGVVGSAVPVGDGRDRPGDGPDVAELHPGRAARGRLGPSRGGDRRGHLLPDDGRRARGRRARRVARVRAVASPGRLAGPPASTSPPPCGPRRTRCSRPTSSAPSRTRSAGRSATSSSRCSRWPSSRSSARSACQVAGRAGSPSPSQFRTSSTRKGPP